MSHQVSQICPVCRMTIEPDEIIAEYRQMRFYFCTQQCYTMFVRRPHLYTHARNREEVVKQRKLAVDPVFDEQQIIQLEQKLMELMGIKNFSFNGKGLSISYDLLQINQLWIEKTLTEAGIKLDQSLLEKLHRKWTRNSEETELDNLASLSAACCNRLPPGA